MTKKRSSYKPENVIKKRGRIALKDIGIAILVILMIVSLIIPSIIAFTSASH